MKDKDKDITISTGTTLRTPQYVVRFYWNGKIPTMNIDTPKKGKPIEFDISGILDFFNGAKQ